MIMRKPFFYLLIMLAFTLHDAFADDIGKQMEKCIENINQDKYQEALLGLKYIDNLNKKTPNLHLCSGICFLNLKQFDNAVKEFKQEIKLYPSSSYPYYFLAMIYEYRNEKQKAIDYWQKFIKLTKNKKLKKLAAKHIKCLKGK